MKAVPSFFLMAHGLQANITQLGVIFDSLLSVIILHLTFNQKVLLTVLTTRPLNT